MEEKERIGTGSCETRTNVMPSGKKLGASEEKGRTGNNMAGMEKTTV